MRRPALSRRRQRCLAVRGARHWRCASARKAPSRGDDHDANIICRHGDEIARRSLVQGETANRATLHGDHENGERRRLQRAPSHHATVIAGRHEQQAASAIARKPHRTDPVGVTAG